MLSNRWHSFKSKTVRKFSFSPLLDDKASQVDTELVSALVGVVFGAVGYWIATFWMQPIVRYRELRSKVLSELVFFSQVTNAEGLNGRMQEL